MERTYLKSHVAGTIVDRGVEGYKRWQAVQSLHEQKTDSPEGPLPTAELEESAKSLAKTLLQKDADRFVRLGAAGSLGRLAGVAGKIGAAALALVLRREEDVNLRRRAAASLGEFGSEVGVLGVQSLTGALAADSDEHVRWRAAESIGRLGPAAGEQGVEALAKALGEDKDVGVRLRAAAALGALGGFAGDVGAAALAKALGDHNISIKDAAKEAVDQLREGALNTLMQPIHGYSRGRAAWALGQLGPLGGAEAIKSLSAALILEADAYVRHRCVEALEKLGSSVDGLVAAAIEKAAAEDADVYVQVRASELSCRIAELYGITAGENERAELDELLRSQAQVFLDLQKQMPNFGVQLAEPAPQEPPPGAEAAKEPSEAVSLSVASCEAPADQSADAGSAGNVSQVTIPATQSPDDKRKDAGAAPVGDVSQLATPAKEVSDNKSADVGALSAGTVSRASPVTIPEESYSDAVVGPVDNESRVASPAKASRGSGKTVCLDDEAQIVEIEVETRA